MGENKRSPSMSESDATPDRLDLTPQQRVSDHDVLMLNPDIAIDPEEEWFEYEEPPFEMHDSADDEPADASQPLADDISDETAEESALDVGFTHNTVHDESIEAFFAKAKKPSSAELTERIAALENAIERASEIYEPEGDEDEDMVVAENRAIEWVHQVVLDATGAPMPDVSEEQDVVVDSLSDEEQVIDEMALRDLVADIVREELQGPLVSQIVRAELQGDLGERITRNVRKMVRVEIQRALAARALD